MNGALLRIFHAEPRLGSAEELGRRFQSESAALVRSQPGCLGYIAAGPDDAGEMLFMSLWRTRDDLERFAGPNWEESVLPPGYAELIAAHHVEHRSLLVMSFTSTVD